MKKRFVFALLFSLLLGTCALSEPVSGAYGSIQFQLPEGFTCVERADKYIAYESEDGSKQVQVGELISLDDVNMTQFLGSIDDIIDIFVAYEQILAPEEGFLGTQRTFIGDLPSMHVKAEIDGLRLDYLFLLNRYDSIAVVFTSNDNEELIDYFVENIVAKLSPR